MFLGGCKAVEASHTAKLCREKGLSKQVFKIQRINLLKLTSVPAPVLHLIPWICCLSSSTCMALKYLQQSVAKGELKMFRQELAAAGFLLSDSPPAAFVPCLFVLRMQ